VPADRGGWQDDEAFAAGVGFTEIVSDRPQRPLRLASRSTNTAEHCSKDSSSRFRPQIVISTFKETAKRLFGNFAGNGFVPGLTLGEIEVL
jgi:hypothetical protein